MSSIKSLSKGLKAYKFIVDYGKPILAVTLCEKLQIDKSTMSRLLKTLKDEDFISYLENSNEIIANEISYKTNQSTKIELLIKKTKTLLEEISLKTDECAYLGIFDDYKVSYINQIDLSNRELKTRNNIGIQANLHTSALGKSILAFGNYDFQKIKFNQFTNNTITNIKKLESDIEEVKKEAFQLIIKSIKMECVVLQFHFLIKKIF